MTLDQNVRNSVGQPVSDFLPREIVIVNGIENSSEYASRYEYSDPDITHVPILRAESEKDEDSISEGKFSEYISKVKRRMLRTVSSIGLDMKDTGRQDGLNDKVGTYINHAKMKIRTTTNVGHTKSVLLE